MTKKALAICLLPLFLAAANSARERLVGGWRLVSLEEPGAPKVDCCGLFVFTRDGHASVQVMQHEPQGSNPYSRGGYEATYGTYVVDENTHTFTLHVEGALASPLVGKDLRRAYQFSGKRLIVTSADPNEHWKVTWEHY